jgi:hypothetical protein
MNFISQIQVNYLRPNRTIETYLLIDKKDYDKCKVVYIYNYEGYHYRIFENVIELSNFLNDVRYKLLKEYSTDRGVNNFLSKYEFST